MLLAGDIGGTKTTLGIFSDQTNKLSPLIENTYPSNEYPDLDTIVIEFLEQSPQPVKQAVFGVAGPVVGRRASITNLPWTIDAVQLEKRLNLSSVDLINDLEAIAHAVPQLTTDDLYPIIKGNPLPGGNIGIIAPGTGLGEAFLTWNGTRYQPFASEGGHGDFAPASKLQLDLLRYLQKRFDHVSYELVCSGKGIPNIYQFLKDSEFAAEQQWVKDQLAATEDHTPVIVQSALEGEPPCQLCTETLSIFISILGAEAGNTALRLMATGGVYLGGGIPPRIKSELDSDHFRKSFTDKGRFKTLLETIPVQVICNPKVALLGAAHRGLQAADD